MPLDSQLIAQLNLFAFGFLFVELVVATPVEWRTFVSVTPAAKKQTDKNPKKSVFSVLLDSVLGHI